MIGALISLLSLNLTLSLVTPQPDGWGLVYKTLPITGVTTTTPIVVTSVNHRFPIGRVLHGVITGVTGATEANDKWVLTPIDNDTFSLSTFDAQGTPVTSVGVHAYTGGGQIQYAFPEGQILLGRRNKMLATMVVTPRIVFIPTAGPAWIIEPYGGSSTSTGPAQVPNVRGSDERQSMREAPTLGTQFLTFEVYVNGSGPDYGSPLSPDFADFDATQALSHAMFAELFDMLGNVSLLRESWPSQVEAQGAMTQRGQQWMGIIQIPVPVRPTPIPWVPSGVIGEIDVQPADPLLPDDLTTIVLP